MSDPFATRRDNGIAWVDRKADEAFRKVLLAGVPANLHSKMSEALATLPSNDAQQHALRYFGKELTEVVTEIAPLLEQLNRVMSESFALRGFIDWLDATGYGNDVRMIKVLKEWSEMKISTPTVSA